MAAFTGPERASCVFWFEESKSATTVQRNFRTKYAKNPPCRPTIYEWHKCFVETGCSVKHKKSSGRPSTSDEVVEQVRQSFVNSPTKSTRRASRELQVPHMTVWRVLRKRLHLKPYRLSLVQAIKHTDRIARKNFCADMLNRLDVDEHFLDNIIFSDESTFHLSGKVNTHNCRIWGSENPHETLQHARDSPKVNVFCALSKNKMYGPYFFQETTINGIVYLDMLQQFLIPQIDEDDRERNVYFMHDGAPPHYLTDVRDFLNDRFPGQWIGRAAPIACPPVPQT